MLAFVSVLALAAVASVSAAPALESRQASQFQVLNNGTQGSVTGTASDFSATYHASSFLTRRGCSTTASITACYAAELAADPTKGLETADYKPYVPGGVGTNQRALLLSESYFNATGVVTHKVRFHISTTYTAVPVGFNNSVFFAGLRNFNANVGVKALDIRARTFTGEETSGTFLYVSQIDQQGSEDFPTGFALADAIGKTIEVTWKLGVNGATIDTAGVFVAEVSAKIVQTGALIFSLTSTKTLFPKGVVDPQAHRILFGADRRASAGQQALKVWFGDYSVSPAQPVRPE